MNPSSKPSRHRSHLVITSASTPPTKGERASSTAGPVRCVGTLVGAMALSLAGVGAASAAPKYSEATITVEGGPHAGTHSLRVEDVGCELRKRPGKPRYFNDNFGLAGVTDPKKLSFVLVRLRNVDGAGNPAQADFDASVTFGKMNDAPSTYYMSGTNDVTGRVGGTGKFKLKEDGDIARVSFELAPQAGITVKGQLSCTIIRY